MTRRSRFLESLFYEFYNIIDPISTSLKFSNSRWQWRLLESTDHRLARSARGEERGEGWDALWKGIKDEAKVGSLAEWRRNLETRPCSRGSVTLILLTREEGYTRGSLLKSLVAVVDNEAGDDTEECPLYTLPSPSHKGGEQYPDTPATKHRNTVIIEETKVAFAVGKKCRATRVLPGPLCGTIWIYSKS